MKKKIIQVLPSFNVGGAESLVRNYLTNMDRDKYEIEAFVTGNRLDSSIEQDLLNNSIKVTFLSELYNVNVKLPNIIKRLFVSIKWRRAIRKFFKISRPDVVHCHLSVARALIVAKKELSHAKLFYTVHSDPDKYWANGKNPDEQQAIKYFVKKNALTFIALHKEAESKIRFYFGNNCNIRILNNAVDLEKYIFTPEQRKEMRSKLKISDNAFVLGHVGRFWAVKNHDFLLDVFKFVVTERPESILCMVGDGELRDTIEKKAQALGVIASVKFLGNRSDVPQILSIFDAFVFPSLWEGFPLTLIEAQAARLPCFVSDTVNHCVEITNHVTFLSLSSGAKDWARAILDHRNEEFIDKSLSQYGITSVIEKLMGIYGI